jgi:methionine-rich copper-binding protein CopC
MKKIFLEIGLTLTVWLALAVVVNAHAHLVTAFPEPGAAVNEPPAELWLEFSDDLIMDSHFVLYEGEFNKVEVETMIDPADSRRIVSKNLPQLAPGVYNVQWQITTTDEHTQLGSYQFSITGEETMLTSTVLSEVASYNPPAIVAWIAVFVALGLPIAAKFWMKSKHKR